MFFFFNDTATTEIYTLSLHDALPILPADHVEKHLERVPAHLGFARVEPQVLAVRPHELGSAFRNVTVRRDRKSTRLNSSHANISYAVFCLKKKKKPKPHPRQHLIFPL